jgi:hypothetical protein
LAITFADALELSVHDRDWLLERIGTQRSREAKELEKAAWGRQTSGWRSCPTRKRVLAVPLLRLQTSRVIACSDMPSCTST